MSDTSWISQLPTPRQQRQIERHTSSLDKSKADKVGLLIVRGLDTDQPEILFTRVNPKNVGERAHLSIPRETRDRFDETTKQWIDPRQAGPDAQLTKYEPVRPALLRVGIEEAGLPLQAMRDHWMQDIGEHVFISRKGDRSTVQWYMIDLDEAQQRSMVQPKDAVELKWVPCADLHALAEYENINPGYLGVIAAALKGHRENTLTKFSIPFTEAQLTR